MFGSYLKSALRNILKRKWHSAIVVTGLSIGLAGAILIFLYLRHERTYDAFHEKADRIVRLALLENYSPQERFFNTVTPVPLGPAVKEGVPEVVRFARVYPGDRFVRTPGSDTLTTQRCRFVDPALLEIFTFPLLRGDPATALRGTTSVVLAEDAARRFFPGRDPIGQTLAVRTHGEAFEDFVVTGVAAAVPDNSSIKFDLLVPLESVRAYWPPQIWQAWFNVNLETFVEMAPGTTAKGVEAKLNPMIGRLAQGQDFKPGVYVVRVQPLRSIHLDTSFPEGGPEPRGDPAALAILAGIAVLILLIAGINFVTLSIGRSASRAREVGVRKAIGADRGALMRQFWGEAVLVSVLSVAPALALVELLLPTFRSLSGAALRLDTRPSTILFLVLLLAVTGLGAGAYPAVVLSRFHPVAVLKGRLRVRGKAGLRTALVLFQFGLSIFLVTCALVMARQLRFLQARDLGYRGEQVVALRTNGSAETGRRIHRLLADRVASRPEFLGAAAGLFEFGQTWARGGFTADDRDYREFMFNVVTPEYLDVLRIPVVEGRGFSREFAEADARGGFVINETMARMFGWDSAVGKRLPGKRFGDHRIVGVVKDFHFESLHDKIRPLLLALDPAPVQKGLENINYSSPPQPKILVRLRPENIPAAMDTLRSAWREVAPGLPFDAMFVDEAVDAMYRSDRRLGRIVNLATLCAILIANLGLLGLSALAVAQKTKEVGIRKVLGASSAGIAGLLSRDFVLLVAASNLIAWPLAAYAMGRWLRSFAYRTSMGWEPFILSAVAGLVIAQVTVALQVVRAARANPVESLRYE